MDMYMGWLIREERRRGKEERKGSEGN